MADVFTPLEEILALVANLNKAAVGLEATAKADLHVARRNLQLEAQKLVYSLDEPNVAIWPRIFQVSRPILHNQCSVPSCLIQHTNLLL